jgi:hypothetical protein
MFWSSGDRSDRMRLGPAGPALHWRHLHQQGSAACSIFLQGFAGWGRMPLAALCCSPLCLLSTAQTEKTKAERNAGGKGAVLRRTVTDSAPATPPCQDSRCQKLAQATAAQWATGSRRSSFVRLCKRRIPITPGWPCNGTIFTQILLSL